MQWQPILNKTRLYNPLIDSYNITSPKTWSKDKEGLLEDFPYIQARDPRTRSGPKNEKSRTGPDKDQKVSRNSEPTRTRRRRSRTALSRPYPVGQTDNGQFFSKIRAESSQLTESRQTESGQTDIKQKIQTESVQQTDTGHDFLENSDKNETRTGHGQCCPPTSAFYVNF